MPLRRRARRPWDEDFPDGCRAIWAGEEKEPVGEGSGRPFPRGGPRKHLRVAENSSAGLYVVVKGCRLSLGTPNMSVMLFVAGVFAVVGQTVASHCPPESEGPVGVFSGVEARISKLDSPSQGRLEDYSWEPQKQNLPQPLSKCFL